jgi:drug/metabolite transporter (DMT)-like permease
MADINFIYLLIPFIFSTLHSIILTKYSRNEWSLQIAFYRQLWIILVWIPLFFFLPFEFKILIENISTILITSIIWATFLFLNFKSLDYIPVAIWKVFQTAMRILITILIWMILLSENINLIQIVWIFLLILWIFSLLRKWSFSIKWISLSIISWIVVAINWYFFVLYSKSFSPLIAGYILEFFNWLFLLLFLLLSSFIKDNSVKKSFKIKLKSFWIILLSAPLILISSWAISKSYEIYDFTIVWLVLTMSIPASMIFWYFILKEKLSIKSILSIILITLSIIIIKYFW